MRFLLALILTLAIPAAGASAAARLVIQGAGFGHGVGMSQFGADGYAAHGKDYRFILAHYYRGTAIGSAPAGETVRVLLQPNLGRASFTGANRAGGRRLNPRVTYVVERRSGSKLSLATQKGTEIGTYPAPLRVTGEQPVKVLGLAAGVRDGVFRGALELRPGVFGGVNVINAVPLDDYVRGVVAAEMPSSWHTEALKVQAVAARTYALTTNVSGAGFEQYADTRSQVYRGIAAETARTDAAVAATAGQIVTYAGKAAVTYFFSTSGGRTENVEYSFLGSDPKPWLKSVSDPYDAGSSLHRWTIRLTLTRAAAKLSGLVKGSLRAITVTKTGRSPRIVRAVVVGSKGRTNVSGPTLKARLGLYDTWASFTTISSSGRPIAGPSPAPAKPEEEKPKPTTSGGIQPKKARGAAKAHVAALSAPAMISGAVVPAAPGSWVTLQRRGRHGWELVTLLRLSRSGRYSIRVDRRGRYRVGTAAGPGPIVTVG
jgi:stage II sporulation protein D